MNGDQLFFANVSDLGRFREAIRRFDELNAADPSRVVVEGESYPRELLNAQRLSCWVTKLNPNASEHLRLAARSQHLCRWTIPRNSHEMTRAGYHRWRNDLKEFHARKSSDVLRAVGYSEEMIARVRDLNLKRSFPDDPESRTMEDALCLVFLQFQFEEFASKTDDEKVINALQKSWKKMTPRAHEEALKLKYGPREAELIQRALS